MKIILNNREEEFEADKLTVSSMLMAKKFTYKLRIVKINGILIQREKYDETPVNEGDNVQMIYLMSGG